MKSLVLLVAVLFLGTVAQAEVYKCLDRHSRGGNQGYILALTDDTGIIYENKRGYFHDIDSQVTVGRAMDGGPIRVLSKSKQKVINWDNEKACFVFGKPDLSFVILMNSQGDMGSVVQFSPVILTMPDVLCPIPVVGTAPPQPIKCELL